MLSKKTIASQPYWVWGFLGLLVFLPLPFGANRAWASDLFGVLAGVLLLGMLWDLKAAAPWTGPVPRKRLLGAAVGLSLVVLWAFFQTLSFSPQSWHHPIWVDAAQLLGPRMGSISVDPGALPEALVRLLGYVAFFLLAFYAGRDRDRAKLIVRFIAGAGLVYAVYGLLEQSMGGDRILWYKKWAYQGFLTSTFVNKNSYAAYAGLGFLCALAGLSEKVKHLVVKDRVLAQTAPIAAWFDSLSLSDYAVFLSPGIILGALALTGSRAGSLSSLLGAMTFLAAVAVYRRWKLQWWFGFLAVIIFLFILFVSMGGDALMIRLGDQKIEEDSITRFSAYTLVKQAISDNPWLGFGLDSFDGAFRLYRDASLPVWFHHAHNDYLEMMMDLGIPFALILFASILLPVSCCLEGIWRRKRDAIFPSLAVAASVLVGAHVLVDFSLHIPAVAATYATLLGLGVAQSFSSRDKKTEDKQTASKRTPPHIAAQTIKRISPAVQPQPPVVEPPQPEEAPPKEEATKEKKIPKKPSPRRRRR